MQQKRFILFLVLAILFAVVWQNISLMLWPPPKPQDQAKQEDTTPTAPRGPGAWASLAKQIPAQPPRPVEPIVGPSSESTGKDLITLGQDSHESGYHMQVKLDPYAAGVRSVVLNKFQTMDEDGRPVWIDKKKKIPLPLELITDEANRRTPSNVLYHYDVEDSLADRPLDTLGKRRWELVEGVVETTLPDGRTQQHVTFQTVEQGVQFTKTYTLTEREYHLGLEVRLRRAESATSDKVKVRYQLAGAHGMPIEGRWFTSVFRNALIGQVSLEKGSVARNLQDSLQVGIWGGGENVQRDEELIIRYAGVAIQYFASVVVVDDQQEKQDFLVRARPTLERFIVKGIVEKTDQDPVRPSLTLIPEYDNEKKGEVFFVGPNQEARDVYANLEPRTRVALVAYRDAQGNQIVEAIRPPDLTHAQWLNDITVRVTTNDVDLQGDREVVHKYLLYNGPAKPSLLKLITREQERVAPGLVERYVDRLQLNTIIDYHSPNWFGRFANAIYWSDLIIMFTNVMHWVLDKIYYVIPNYGLAIICLTILVRMCLFPMSRKQAYMAIKMQELAPEMKKLQEKYTDRRELGMAQMELYRKHGVNPLGTCWLLLLQMPIFMGLYFALQESIFFRLAEFWPTWIVNLAAPDMLFRWGEGIPLISTPESYGGIFYLGPYFNILPIIAVSLMIVQQKMMTPPPTDEQQAAQQKIMKFMMVIFGFLFYKIAAGLCIYFIASTLWGLVERKFLPKKDLQGAGASATGTDARKPGRAKKREAESAEKEQPPTTAIGKVRHWWRVRKEKMSNWWSKVLEDAKKK